MKITMRESLAEVDLAPGTEPTKIANNTFRYTRPDGTECTRLHKTDILVKRPDGTVVLDSGGFQTYTTKDRLNTFGPVQIYSDRGRWYARSGKVTILYYDGLAVAPDGTMVRLCNAL